MFKNAWTPMLDGILDDIRITRFALSLGLPDDHALGLYIRLLLFSIRLSGDLSEFSNLELGRKICRGDFKPEPAEKLVDAAISAGLVVSENGTKKIADWPFYQTFYDKIQRERDQGRTRKRNYARRQHDVINDGSVTRSERVTGRGSNADKDITDTHAQSKYDRGSS